MSYVRASGVPNAHGRQIPIRSNWNIPLLYQLAESTHDRNVTNFLLYGWPVNHDGRQTSITITNHATAINHPKAVWKYILKEFGHNCLLGPYVTPPWKENVAVSPMSTRPKKDSEDRRIIMDLSWPKDGTAVNDGISDTHYLDIPYKIQYPTIDMLCRRIVQLGPGVMGYKKDMNRAFKQIFTDPADWPLMGIYWEGAYLFDRTTMMASRSAPYCCQQVTSFIRHIMQKH